MATGDSENPESVEGLRAKYVAVALKYRQLVERLERRATRDLAVYRLGAWGLEATRAALAVIEQGAIKVANARFTALARNVRGPLLAVDPAAEATWPDLRTLALDEAARMIEDRHSSREVRVRDQGGTALISVALELSRRGGLPAVMILAENISEQVRRDQQLQRTREALLHRERLRVLGELAVSIAHDLGNTLRGARFQLTMLEGAAVDSERRLEAVRAIATRIEIASSVIARLHEFARTGSLQVAAVRLDRIVAEAAALLETELRAGEAVEVRIAMPDLPPVRGSPAELSLMFVNLLRNARDAMPDGGVVTVTGTRTRGAVVVTVGDQGVGLTPMAEKRLFDPFFSTKGALGTGLGLWLAAGTMERLGGTIKGANRPRGGTLFTLTFPLDLLTRPPRPQAPGRSAASPRAEGSREPLARASRRRRRVPRNGAPT